MSVEKKRAMATPSYMSRTTARAITMPAAPASPCTSRKATSVPTVGASAHSAVATTLTTSPASSGRRRPHRSLIGPTTSWPTAMPTRQAVSVSWTVAAGACRDRVTSGSDGRYMSIASGAVAVSPPSRKVTNSPARAAGAGAGGVLVTPPLPPCSSRPSGTCVVPPRSDMGPLPVLRFFRPPAYALSSND